MCAVVCLFDLNPRTHHITYFVISLCIQFYIIRVSYFSKCCKINNIYIYINDMITWIILFRADAIKDVKRVFK